MLNEEAKNDLDSAQATGASETLNKETEQEVTTKGNWREVFRTAFERARRQQKPAGRRQELGRDKSKALFLLVGGGAALLLLFFGIFSSPKKRTPLPGETPRGQASLGRKITPGTENTDPTKTVIPMLSADVHSSDPTLAGRVTPEDVGRTSRTATVTSSAPMKPSAAKTRCPRDYALGKVDFSDCASRKPPSV